MNEIREGSVWLSWVFCFDSYSHMAISPLPKKYISFFLGKDGEKQKTHYTVLYLFMGSVNKMSINVANSSGGEKLGLFCPWVLLVIPRQAPSTPFSGPLPNTACSVHVTSTGPDCLTCDSSADLP